MTEAQRRWRRREKPGRKPRPSSLAVAGKAGLVEGVARCGVCWPSGAMERGYGGTRGATCTAMRERGEGLRGERLSAAVASTEQQAARLCAWWQHVSGLRGWIVAKAKLLAGSVRLRGAVAARLEVWQWKDEGAM